MNVREVLVGVSFSLGDKMMRHAEYGSQELIGDACFLCGSSEDITAEHVFPKWLQNSYDLWDQQLILLNGTRIPYRNLRIPCCRRCNSDHLSRVENLICNAVSGGYQKAQRLNARTWYLWAGKLFYGILRKELTLRFDQSDPIKETITSKEDLESFRDNLHLFLQEIRGKHKFQHEVPYSVLICTLHRTDGSFDLRDDFHQLSMSIRMGEVGVIVSFEDGGLMNETYGRYVAQVDGRELHPVQFIELYAKVCYQNSLRVHRLTYATALNNEGKGPATTSIANSSTAIRDWNQEEFAKLLQFHLGDDITVEFQPPNLVSTWLVESDGSPMIKSLNEWMNI